MAQEKLFMNITGTVKNCSSPLTLEFTGQGRSNTKISDYMYEYSCSVGHIWEKGEGQRLSLIGTILRAQDHNRGEGQISKAGETASFIAVKRDFVEPRDISGVKIIPSALSMVATKSHRLKHAVWHTLRGIMNGVVIWHNLDEPSKTRSVNLVGALIVHLITREGALDLVMVQEKIFFSCIGR